MSTATAFEFPMVTEHTPIMVAQRPGEPGIPAFVTKVKSSTVSAVAIMTGPGGGLLRFNTCYHADDPRVIEKPGIFEDDKNGIFWIADLELERRAIVKEMRSVERQVSAELAAMNTLLEEMVTRLSQLERTRSTRAKD